MWPELDQLLLDESATPSTPYTAVVPEYRVVFYGSDDHPHLDRNWSLTNGNIVHDVHHPCRYAERISHVHPVYVLVFYILFQKKIHFFLQRINDTLRSLFLLRSNVAIRKELHSSASDRSCTHLEFDISGTGLMYVTFKIT